MTASSANSDSLLQQLLAERDRYRDLLVQCIPALERRANGPHGYDSREYGLLREIQKATGRRPR